MSLTLSDLTGHRPQPQEPRRFRVRVGFETVVVTARDRQEALQAARRLLCQRHPRMWDLIHGLEASRFQIEPLE